MRRDRAGADAVFVGEAAGQNVGVVRGKVAAASRPVHELRVAAAIAQQPQRLVLGVRAGKDQHGNATPFTDRARASGRDQIS